MQTYTTINSEHIEGSVLDKYFDSLIFLSKDYYSDKDYLKFKLIYDVLKNFKDIKIYRSELKFKIEYDENNQLIVTPSDKYTEFMLTTPINIVYRYKKIKKIRTKFYKNGKNKRVG